MQVLTKALKVEGQVYQPVGKEGYDDGQVAEDPEHDYQQVQADQGVLGCWLQSGE